MRGTVKDRFMAKVRGPGTADDCWMWTGHIKPEGYGQMRVAGRAWLAHRLSYELFVGPIPDGHQIDHLCRVRQCVRPDHLEPVIPKVNVARSTAAEVLRARHAAVTHCPQGHEYTPENTAIRRHSGGGTARHCRQCHREKAAKSYAADPRKHLDRTRRWRERQRAA